jgi:hypothetical protein
MGAAIGVVSELPLLTCRSWDALCVPRRGVEGRTDDIKISRLLARKGGKLLVSHIREIDY